MKRVKRQKLTEAQQRCLLMIGDHGLTGTFTEFAHAKTRRTIHQLLKKRMVQWVENRWILSRDGHAEFTLLLIDGARKAG